MNHEDNPSPVAAPGPQPRKPYKPPTLSLFGQVAALTQQGTCTSTNDSTVVAGCTLNTGMGMSNV